LLADYFAPHQRLRALAILASAIPAGVFVGYLAGGLAAQAWGWRAALQIVGLPGLLIGLLVWLTIREPERGAMDEQRGPVAPAEPLVLALRALASNAAYCHVVAGACLFTLGATGSGVWIASYFIRQHGFTGAEIGLWLALLYGGGGICGTLCGGWLAEKTGASARLCAVSLVLALPFTPYVFLGSDRILTLLLHLPVTVLMHMNTGPVLTLIQQLCGAHRRAVAHAVSVMISNLVALPLGPLLVGLFSDQFAPLFGAQALGIGITLLLITTWPMAAWQFTRAANAIGAEYNISGPRPVGPLKPGQAPASLRATL
jgi:predicted MFS family arabinose efflux permease